MFINKISFLTLSLIFSAFVPAMAEESIASPAVLGNFVEVKLPRSTTDALFEKLTKAGEKYEFEFNFIEKKKKFNILATEEQIQAFLNQSDQTDDLFFNENKVEEYEEKAVVQDDDQVFRYFQNVFKNEVVSFDCEIQARKTSSGQSYEEGSGDSGLLDAVTCTVTRAFDFQ